MYIMEGPSEGIRLEMKTSAIETERQLTQIGLQAGMHALDAGCGTGAVSRVMSRMVGNGGQVIGVDSSSERLALGREFAQREHCSNLSFVQADLSEGPVAESRFDLVWSRFVFEYLTEPQVVLKNLISSTKTGGKIVVGDLDGNGQFHYPMSTRLEHGLGLLLNELSGHFDPFVGRKLFHMFRRESLGDIRVHVLPYHLYSGKAPPEELENWRTKLETLRPIGTAALGGTKEYSSWANEFLSHLADPDTFTYSILIIAEGVRLT